MEPLDELSAWLERWIERSESAAISQRAKGDLDGESVWFAMFSAYRNVAEKIKEIKASREKEPTK